MQMSFSRRRWQLALIAGLMAVANSSAMAQLPFFSGAEGFGGTFAGSAPPGGWFSNATIYHVTNLNDSGAGSLRGAFVENSLNKIIVFDVAGTIQLGTSTLDVKNLSNYYIAGQTAPGPVTIYGNTTQITHSSDKKNSNVILRYLTFRKGTGNGEDSITFAGGNGAANMVANNMILDHVSASWAEDEILSVANNNTDVTVQYSMINDALVSNHAYGSLIRPRVDSNVSFHHNFYAHNSSRQARFGTYLAETLTADFRNNVVYNWRDRASYAGGSSEPEREYADVNFVGNYFIAGPGTLSNTTKTFYVDQNVDARVYQSGNFVDSDKQLNPGGQPNGADTGWNMFQLNGGALFQMATPFATEAVTTQSANDAYWQTINHVGNYWWSRDAIDSRVIANVLNNTNAPNGIGASVPNAIELNGVLTAPTITRPAGWDTDSDGMPDVWEVAHGLNPNSPGATPDWKLDFDNDGYINLVEYLNEVGEFSAPAPIVFNGETNNRYALITNWKTSDGITDGSNWQPSRYDEAQVNSGTVVVDAAGQHAGVVKIGANAGNVAQLNITGGWLDVDEAVLVGAHPSAQGTLSLSGGVLSTPYLRGGNADDTFSFTGGVLHADTIEIDVVNNGGTIAPGNSIGQTYVAGSLQLAAGSLQIELASPTAADTLLAEDLVMLGGNLSISTLGGFTPTEGDSWQIIMAGTITGAFSTVTPGYSVQQQGSNLVLFFGEASPLLAGDYNDDGVVDAADYAVWRYALATGGSLPNETASLGTTDQADYDVWSGNFGAVAGGGSGGNHLSVPEPTTLAMLFFASGLALTRRWGRLRIFGSFFQE